MKHQCKIDGATKVGEPDDVALELLKCLAQPGAVLVMAEAMDKAAIIAGSQTGDPKRLNTLTREQALHFEKMGWVKRSQSGKISRFQLSDTMRQKIRLIYVARENKALRENLAGEDTHSGQDTPMRGRARMSRSETPLLALARRKDRRGQPFLSKELVRAGDRLREDFETAHIGPNVCQNWNRFMTGPSKSFGGDAVGITWSAEERVSAALAELGPGLGDVAVSCCCHLEGLETVEKKMGWSARSGKIVLKIALERLKKHYERVGEKGDMIG